MEKVTVKDLIDLGFKVEKRNKYTVSTLFKKEIRTDRILKLNDKMTENILSYKNKIGICQAEIVNKILDADGKNILFIGGAGCGKTYAVLQQASIKVEIDEKNGEKIAYVIIVPNKNQAKQNEVGADLKEFNFQAVVGKTNKKDEAINLDYKRKKYSLVYDKTKEVVEDLKSKGFKVVLIIDEAHKLLTDIFRDTIEDIDKCIDKKNPLGADKTIFMTATPGNLKYHYEFDEVYDFRKEEKFINIDKFVVKPTNDIKKTVIKEIKRITNIKGEKGNLRPLIKLNDLEKAKEFKESFEEITDENGNPKYLVKILNSKNKDSEDFMLIENEGILKRGLGKEEEKEYKKELRKKGIKSPRVPEKEIIICTSVIEVGLSLKDEFIPVEVVLSSTKYNENNTIQFFARPRTKVPFGVLIFKNNIEGIKTNEEYQAYLNKSKIEVLDRTKTGRVRKDKDGSPKMRVIDYTDVVEHKIKDIETYIYNSCLESNRECKVMQEDVEFYMNLYGRKEAIEYFESRQTADKLIGKLNPLELDKDNMQVYINMKKVLNRAERKMFQDMITKAPELFKTCFKDKIFYGELSIEFDNGEIDKEVEEIIKSNIECHKKKKEEKEVQELEIREKLENREIMKALPLILSEKIDEDNFQNFKFKKNTYKDIELIKESKMLELIEDGIKSTNNIKEAVKIINHKNNGEYITKTMARRAFETISYTKINKVRRLKLDSNKKDDIIYGVISENESKTGKINLTEDKVFELAIKLIDNGYMDSKTIKTLKAEIDNLKYKERYTCSMLDENGKEMIFKAFDKENIKNLETLISRDEKIKILNKTMLEISKVYEIKNDKNKYYYVNSTMKKFNLESFISSQETKYYN